MTKQLHILVINPGSTSTKIGLFRDAQEVFVKSLSHSAEEIACYSRIADQYDFREKLILDALRENNFDPKNLDAVVGRGGTLKPIAGGVYEVNEAMKSDLREARYGEHASNLGALIADSIARAAGCRSFIADPIVVDELDDLARISGHPLIPRISIFHALNQKSVARHAAAKLQRSYEALTLIVAHLGGGVSVGLHHKGRVIDVNNALDGEGPFSPERSGGVPVGALIKLCLSGKYTEKELKQMITGKGGLVAYLGTNDAREVKKRVEQGDARARLVYEAMAYQIAKEIGALSTVVSGRVDAVVLTGGLAYEQGLVGMIRGRVSKIAEVLVFPGERELESLRESAARVLSGQEETRVYG